MWGRFPSQGVTLGDTPHPNAPRLPRRALVAAVFPLLFWAARLGAATAPVIDSLSATPSSVTPGDSVTIAVAAHDPDCTTPPCTSGCGKYLRSDKTNWTVSGGELVTIDNGTSASPYSASAVWQAPTVEGNYSVSVLLVDSGTSFCTSGIGPLSVTGTLSIQVTSTPNTPPQIASLTADPASLLAGQQSALTCVASDPDGDPVSYSWSADGGTVTPGAAGEATFSSDAIGAFTVTCAVSDSLGGEASNDVTIAVSAAIAESAVSAGLVTPRRLAVDAAGEAFVVDPGAGGLVVVNLYTGEPVYELPFAAATSIAIDWNGDLLLGETGGARVVDDRGATVRSLAGDELFGDVSDVAVDLLAQRYVVLHRAAGTVVVYDAAGLPLLAFGSTGDGAAQLRGPLGVAVTPSGGFAVGDTGHGEIKIFSASGALASTFGGLGGAVGEFVRLDDVEVDAAGRIYASDSFQDWVQVFDGSGAPLETIGTYGSGVGELQTAAGLGIAEELGVLVVASNGGGSLQLFRSGDPAGPPPGAAKPELAPTTLTFEPQATGTESASAALELRNVGASRLGVSGVSVDGEFAASNDCGPFLAAGAVCSIAVRFRPTVAGPATGLLVVTTSGQPARVAAALAGEAYQAAPEVTLSPAALDFGSQEVDTVSPPRVATLTNTGTAPLAIASITATGEFLATPACAGSLGAGTSCAIEIRFAPTSVADSLVGTLVVASDAAGSPHQVALLGSSTANVPEISIDDWSGDEGGVGEQTAASFVVRLSAATTETVTVDFSTVDGTAESGADYEAAAGTLEFLPGETELELGVTVLGDDLLEPDEETFRVVLTNPLAAVLADDEAEARIVDDETCLGPNLLRNPGAEERPTAAGLPGWLANGASWMRGGGLPAPTEGRYYFAAGTVETAEIVQDVDVSAFASAIDSGEQLFRFEASVRTLYEANPTARIVVEYRDLDNLFPLTVVDSGPLVSPTSWQRLVDERAAPTGTGWIRVRLQSLAPGDAYFDALALRSLRAATVSVGDTAVEEGDVGFRQLVFGVQLACAYYEAVDLDFATRDGSAREGEDYLANLGRVSVAAGETSAAIPVDVVGDFDDEPHETVELDLTLALPTDAVLITGRAQGEIRNDDFCPQSAAAWLADPAGWPVDWLELGGVEYEQSELLALLDYHGGKDEMSLLAQQLVATKLNLARGSQTYIQTKVARADDLLASYPPGSRPRGGDKREVAELTGELEDYNSGGCQ